MAITPIGQTITGIPQAGKRGVDIRDEFVTKQETFQDAVSGTGEVPTSGLVLELNELITDINDDIVVGVNQAVVDVEADKVTTNADVVLTGLDVVSTNADVVSTNADVVSTNADVVSTNADVTETELLKWEAEAWKLTAESFATEAEDVLVKLYTSDGDGTFTFTNHTDYSATHYKNKAVIAAAAIPIAGVGDAGKLVEVNATENGYDLIVGDTKYLRSDESDTLSGDLTVNNLVTAGNVDGRDVSVDGAKLDTIADNANNYSLPASVVHDTEYASSTVGGTVKMRVDGSTLYIRNDGTNA